MSASLPVPLSPRGTARQRLEGALAYPAALAAELHDAEPDPGAADDALYLAWQASEWADRNLGAADRSALLVLFARTLAAVSQGSTRLTVDDGARALLARAPAVVGGAGERRPFVLEGDHLYPQRLWAAEERLAAALADHAARPPLFSAAAIDSALDGDAQPRPTSEQRAAVAAALARRFAVITGGAGTGKTTVVLTLVRALLRLGVAPDEIALAAPTGKAANRLDEAVRAGSALRAPVTLHRLLGFSPRAGVFLRGEHQRLPQRAIIVDEGSMINLFLMERLATAVGEGALLVILGDADQLPSVETGAVFRDMAALTSNSHAALRLSQSFRMDPARDEGRRNLEAARALRSGETLEAMIAKRTDAAAVSFLGPEIAPASAREALLERWYAERIAAFPDLRSFLMHDYRLDDDGLAPEDEARVLALHRHMQSFRLLCLTRGRPTGVEACNAWLHRRHGAGSAALVPGEPLLMLHNDYDRGLFNGDQGLVLRVRQGDRPARPMALFPVAGRWAAFDLDSLHDSVTLAFAMTVHKAQGSEYDHVVLFLPDTAIPLLSRELLYTALTRSRRSVLVCGSPAVLATGAGRPLVRSSGVAEKLARALAAEARP